MKPLANLSQISKRLSKVATTPPAKPLKGHGFDRVECTMSHVFPVLANHAPNHCAVVTNREPINRFGKLGFAGHSYVSPELWRVVAANYDDFKRLESSMATVAEFGL